MRILQLRGYAGRNIYSHYPVVAMLVDLGQYDGHKTSELPGLNGHLLEALPGLRTHHCATGKPGGFVQRLEDGTFLGHVIEHVALELQSVLGWNVVYGKTRQTGRQGTYNVVFECGQIEGGLEAGQRAVEIVKTAATGRCPDALAHLEAIRQVAEETALGPSTAALVAEAGRRGLPVRRIGRTSLVVLGHGHRQRRIWATITSRTPSVAVDLAGDKLIAKDLLAESGLPVPPGLVVANRRQAARALAALGGIVVVKPVSGNQGRGVSLNLTKPGDVKAAFKAAAAISPKVIVEKHIPGRHYRLLVVGERMVAAAEKLPARVTGDGQSSVQELVDRVNLDPLRGPGHQRPLSRIVIDPVAELVLARQDLTPEAVPVAGQTVYLRENGNLSTGGTARDATDEVHPANAAMAVRAVRTLGLDVGGVDIVTDDISRELGEAGGAVIEVNAAPGLRMHLHPSQGRPRDVAGPILDSLFTGWEKETPRSWMRCGPWRSQPGRIPIVAVTGTNGKTTVSRLVAHILERSGLTVGLASTDGAWVGRERLLPGDCAGPRTAAAILTDPRVEAAVLETARGGILRDGLAFDACDVGVVTNISPDHEGQDGLERLEDLAWVKALVVEAVARDGRAVLNADDPFVYGMADRAGSEVVFFSRGSGSLIVRKHLQQGGRAVHVVGESVVAEGPAGPVTVAALSEIPLTFGGSLVFQVENVAAAVAAAWSLGVPVSIIRRALRSFGRPHAAHYASNPGRFELYRTGSRVTVAVDYGHNRTAYTESLNAVRGLCQGRLHAVIGAPGDRLDEHLLEMGRMAARAADHILIKEDVHGRGRTPGEVAAVFLRGVLDTGFPEARVEIVLNEREALARALERAKPEDWVIVYFEKREPLVEHLRSLRTRPLDPARAVGRSGRRSKGARTGRTDRDPGVVDRTVAAAGPDTWP